MDEQDRVECRPGGGTGGGPPQSRKWSRTPGSTSTTKPSGSAEGSGSGAAAASASALRSIAPRIRGPCPSAAGEARTSLARRRRADERFERLVEVALDGIPPPFSAALDEVAIVIEDDADDEQLALSGLGPDDALYGLYEGTPRTAWGADLVPFPNKISLFRIPLEEDFPDPGDLAEEVRITVIHELAHHLGMDDDRLEQLGFD